MDKMVELSVKDFKAVKKADISLNGITVVSGINGCGKSTLSQLLYYSFYYANRFDEVVGDILNTQLSGYADAFRQMERIIKNAAFTTGNSIISRRVTVNDKDDYLLYIEQLFANLLHYKNTIEETRNREAANSLKRIARIMADTVGDFSQEDLDKLLNSCYNQIVWIFDTASEELKSRDYFLLEDYLFYYMQGALPQEWNIQEYGVPFVGDNAIHIPLLHYIKRVAYIDTPMIVGSGLTVDKDKDYWKHLAELLNTNSHIIGGGLSLYNNLAHIIHGESVLTEDGIRKSSLSYKREDGKIFDLKDCATGVKSFSILQLLLKNGFLQKDTLLIIDEPEAHLHPQWIVEYARMIVLLHKEIGVKFFIASHSTDMVSAIRYIAAKEGVQERLNFYLAEDSIETPYEYLYRELGLDIDPIFKSFNKSFDKIDEYGISE